MIGLIMTIREIKRKKLRKKHTTDENALEEGGGKKIQQNLYYKLHLW